LRRTVWAFIRCRTTTPAADFCRPVRMDRSTLSPDFGTNDRSPEVSSTAFRTQPPEFTTSAFDGYGLRCQLPARPAPYASNPVLVHRLVRLLHASFRPSVAGTPLRFAMTSPPSGCQGDFHPRAVEHARHTTKKPSHTEGAGGFRAADFFGASPVASALGVRSGATPRGQSIRIASW